MFYDSSSVYYIRDLKHDDAAGYEILTDVIPTEAEEDLTEDDVKVFEEAYFQAHPRFIRGSKGRQLEIDVILCLVSLPRGPDDFLEKA